MKTAESIFSMHNELDALMVLSEKNRLYYTGFASTFGVLIFLRDGKTHFYTDARYYEMAQQHFANSNVELHLFGANTSNFDSIYQFLLDSNVSQLGFEDTELTVNEFNNYRNKFKELKFVPCGGSILEQRKIKTQDEIDLIAKAQSITDGAFKSILKFIKVGVTELDIACELEYQMRKLGGTGLAFDTIVASGINGSKPHAHPTDKKIANGDAVTMDFGARYNGYCSDMTRTVFVGKPNAEVKNIYEIVLKAQKHAIKNLACGMSGAEGHALAAEIIDANGYGEYFTHGLGHSVGLDIHEEPRLSPRYEQKLQPNVLITVEPGIYVPNVGGVRIEDLVVIKEDRVIDLTSSEKNIIIL